VFSFEEVKSGKLSLRLILLQRSMD